MRYYEISVTNPSNNQEIIRWSTQNSDGSNNLSAQQIEIDIPVYTMGELIGAAFLKIWGVPLAQIGSAFNLNNMNIQIFGGMSKGLPLNNPAQQGLMLNGTIQQCYGNWNGLDQNLNFQIIPQFGTQATPKNIVLNWKKGTSLSQAITNTLGTAFPGYKLNISISPNLIISEDQPGFFQTLPQFAKQIRELSQNIVKDATYQGVRMVIGNGFINVFDGSSKKTPIEVSFTDMIGQPIWNGLNQIQFRLVMRADINVSDYVRLPRSIATNTPQGFSQFRNQPVFQGVFQVQSVRQVGNSRGFSGNDWITVYDAISDTGAV